MGTKWAVMTRPSVGIGSPVDKSLSRKPTARAPASAGIRDPARAKDTGATEARLAAIVQSSLDAIVGKTIDGVVTSWNPAATGLFGWSAEEIVGNRIDIFIPPQRRDEEKLLLKRVASGEKVDPYETERLTKDQGTIQVALSSSPIRSLSGEIEGVASIYSDIGWIKKRETMYQSLLEASHDAIIGVDAEGVIQVVNAQAEKLFGYERYELIGRMVETLVPVRDKGAQYGGRNSPFTHGTTISMGAGTQLTARHKDGGEFPVDIALSSLETDEGIIGIALRDIGDQIRTAEENEKLEQQLKRSRLESIGQLVGGIAHDFNNLLAGIMSYSKLVQEQVQGIHDRHPDETFEQVVEDVEQIVGASERAASLTKQLLLFGRQDVAQLQILDLNQIVSGMADLLRRTIGEQIRLRTDLTKPLGAVNLDAGHLEQILMNLVVNARDAMTSDGRLFICTSEKTVDFTDAAEQGVEPGDYVVLSVSDTGTGMPAHVIERAFEPYFSTKPRGEGSGLGLATTYGIVTQSGGHISIDSEMGLGTTVNVYLPMVKGHIATPSPAAKTTVKMNAGETILLVEDEEIIRAPAARFLQKAGYNVLIAADPEIAIELAHAQEEPIDLLLTDVVMPGMTGKELAETLLLSKSVQRVMYMSGYTKDVISHQGDVIALQGVEKASVARLDKPFTAQKLLAVVRDLLDSKPL